VLENLRFGNQLGIIFTSNVCLDPYSVSLPDLEVDITFEQALSMKRALYKFVLIIIIKIITVKGDFM